MRNRLLGAAALAAALVLAGCYESTDVTVHDPGQYKGARDPLLEQSATARAEQLQKRFQLVQVER